jgi:hypothetical protein
MAVKVLALASGVTGLADHRILEANFAQPEGALTIRSGLFKSEGGGNLSTVSAMVARVAPLRAIIANSISASLGPYLLVSDANVDITFEAGEASVPRTDRIIARVRDNTNDGSGSTAGSVEYLKGQASGSATAMPNNSLLLYEMSIPAGASAGGGGVNFANAVNKRVYTTASGGIIPVANATDMSGITTPYEGMACYRIDIGILYIYVGGVWRPRGVASVASSSNLTDVVNVENGNMAVARDTGAIYLYNGSTWVPPKRLAANVGRAKATSGQSLADATWTSIALADEDFDTGGYHSNVTNNTRVTPSVAGYYRFTGTGSFEAQTTPSGIDVAIRKNGSDFQGSPVRIPGTTTIAAQQVSVIVSMNGSTDYVELMMRQDSAGSDNTQINDPFRPTLEWEYIGPTSY